MLGQIIFRLFAVLAFLCFYAPLSFGGCACDHGALPGAVRPCPSLRDSEVIFVGTVVDIEGPMDVTLFANPWPMLRYTFKVEENLHGAERDKTIQVYSVDGEGCGPKFNLGVSYLVDSGVLKGLTVASLCGEAQPAASAAEILEKLRALRDNKFIPSIKGTLILDRMPPYGISRLDGRPVPEITLHLVGTTHALTTQTDQNGAFRFVNVPADTYHFEAELPPNLQLDYTSGGERPYKFPDNACFDVRLRVNLAVPRAVPETPQAHPI